MLDLQTEAKGQDAPSAPPLIPSNAPEGGGAYAGAQSKIGNAGVAKHAVTEPPGGAGQPTQDAQSTFGNAQVAQAASSDAAPAGEEKPSGEGGPGKVGFAKTKAPASSTSKAAAGPARKAAAGGGADTPGGGSAGRQRQPGGAVKPTVVKAAPSRAPAAFIFSVPGLGADDAATDEEALAPLPPPTGEALASYKAVEARAEVTMLLDQLRASGEQRKGEIRAAADRSKEEICADGLAHKMSVQAQVGTALADIQAEVAATRAAARREGARQKAIGTIGIAGAMLQVVASTAATAAGIAALGSKHKQAAAAAVASRQQAARDFGVAQGERAKLAVDGQAAEAAQRGNAKAAGYPADELGQAQAEAVLTISGECVKEIKKAGPDLQERMEESGRELADGLDGARGKLDEEFDQQFPAVAEELAAQSGKLLVGLATLQGELDQRIDEFVEQFSAHLYKVELAAAAELQALADSVAAQVDLAVVNACELIDRETAAAARSVDRVVEKTAAGLRGQKRPAPDSARAAIASAERAINTSATAFAEALGPATAALHAAMQDGAGAAASGAARCATNVAGDLAVVTATMLEALGRIGAAASASAAAIVEKWGAILAETAASLDTRFAEAVAGLGKSMDQGLEPGKAKLIAELDKAIAKNREPLAKLDSQMEAAAKEARDKYNAPWYKKAARWVWNAIKGVFWALVTLLVLVALFIVAIALLIIGLVEGIALLIGIALVGIALIIGFAVYGIIKGVVNRVSSAKTWYGMIWGGVVGVLDIVGIPGLIEGIAHRDIVTGRKLSEEEAGERFGGALVAFVMALLPLKGKFGRAPKAPLELPPPELPPVPELQPPPEVASVLELQPPPEVAPVPELQPPPEVPVPSELPEIPRKPVEPPAKAKPVELPEGPNKPAKPKKPAKVTEEPVETAEEPVEPVEPAEEPVEPAAPEKRPFPQDEFPSSDLEWQKWPPSKPIRAKGVKKPKWHEPGGTRFRYDRYRYRKLRKSRKKSTPPSDLLSPEEYYNKHLEPQSRGQSVGEPGSPAHKALVAKVRKENGIRTQTEGAQRPDAVGEKGISMKVGDRTIDPEPGGRVLYEAENFYKDGSQMVSEGRAQVRQFRLDNPNDTIVVQDVANPANIVEYKPGTQPPPPGYLKRGAKNIQDVKSSVKKGSKGR